ncbi:MAG: HIT domain-containing protein [Candidatus Omnitrophica bacterium]|nr:HIT domain-containing protein [Candidatus Omnitrophota bacterium]
MDKLWAPWRIDYVQGKKKKGCIFCSASKDRAGSADGVVFKTPHSVCMLNIYPYNNGHLMVAPMRHVKYFSKLSDGELLDLMRSVEKARSLLDAAIKPGGYNIGVNMSAVAGAGIPGHLHVHIVPRWKGDTNFMPVIGRTKVISQSLEQLLKLLKNAHAGTHKRIRK